MNNLFRIATTARTVVSFCLPSVADNVLSVEVSGPAELKALGNADIKDLDPYFDSTHKAWMGRALAAIFFTGDRGPVTLTVTSPSLPAASVTVGALNR